MKPSAIALLIALVATACSDTGGADDSFTVVATTSIWGDVVQRIVGDDAAVTVLIPAGADAHDFIPSSRQVADLNDADLVIANGLGLESGFGDVLEAAAADGVPVIELAPLLSPIAATAKHEEGDDDHNHEDADPHVWMDPLRLAVAVPLIADALDEHLPGPDWQARASEYRVELEELNDRIEALLSSIETRKIVTNHEALGYFAERYDFEVIGTVIPGASTLAEPSSADLAELVETMKSNGVTVVFAETTSPTDLARAVAAELGTGTAVVELFTESLGESGSGADTVIGMLEENARLISENLGG